MRKKIKILLIGIVIFLIAAFLFVYSPYIDAMNANRHLEVGNIKFLMKQEAVEKAIGKGEVLGGFGARFFVYEELGLTIAYNNEGLLHNRVAWIQIKSDKHRIYGIMPGDSHGTIKEILVKQGFQQSKEDSGLFSKGNIQMIVNEGALQIQINDWTIKNHVY